MRQRTNGVVKTTCSKCGNELEKERVGKQKYCLACHAAYMRAHRPKHSELSEEARKRANARAYLKVYIKRGKLSKGPCMVCGTTRRIEAHHRDYNKPLEVEWYCRKHHVKIHYEQKEI